MQTSGQDFKDNQISSGQKKKGEKKKHATTVISMHKADTKVQRWLGNDKQTRMSSAKNIQKNEASLKVSRIVFNASLRSLNLTARTGSK